jgi:hypothetical protein
MRNMVTLFARVRFRHLLLVIYIHWLLTTCSGPMDLMLRSGEAVQKVMGANSPCTKRGMGVFEIFDLHGGFSLEAILDTDSHRTRRQIWDRAQNSQGTEDSHLALQVTN